MSDHRSTYDNTLDTLQVDIVTCTSWCIDFANDHSQFYLHSKIQMNYAAALTCNGHHSYFRKDSQMLLAVKEGEI